MLERALFDLGIFTGLDHLDPLLPFLFHLGSEVDHPLLVLELDLVAQSFMVVAHLGHLFVEGTMQGVRVFLLPCILLLLFHF